MLLNILLGILIGITVCAFLILRVLGRKKYIGCIVITEHKGITLFSLELDGDPKDIVSEKEVTFKVKIPEEESDRE